MFGVRLRSLFTSRWMALLWGVLVILTAIGYVGAASDKDGSADNATTPDGVTPDQQRAIANAF